MYTLMYTYYWNTLRGRDAAGVTFFIQVARPGQNRSGYISGTRRESVQPATGRLGVVDIMHWHHEHMMISSRAARSTATTGAPRQARWRPMKRVDMQVWWPARVPETV